MIEQEAIKKKMVLLQKSKREQNLQVMIQTYFKTETEISEGHWSFWQIAITSPDHLVQTQRHFQL